MKLFPAWITCMKVGPVSARVLHGFHGFGKVDPRGSSL